jgi:hypothetical protein
MNPGITEEAGLTARTLVEAFKSTPAMLAIVVFNIVFMGVVAYSSYNNHARWENESTRWSKLVEITMGHCIARPSTD